MSEQEPGGLNKRYRDCLRDDEDHNHNAPSTAATHRNRIRERVFRSITDGSLLCHSLPAQEREKIFNRITTPEQGSDVVQRLSRDEIDEARKLRRGIAAWLSLYYMGTQEAKNYFSVETPQHRISDDGSAEQVPNLHFDFEEILREAIQKAESRRGRKVIECSIEIETEPIPDNPWDDLNTEELLTRFENRDPTLTGQEIAYLEQEGVIDGKDWQQYNQEAYNTLQNHTGGMVGSEEISNIQDETEGR